MTIAQLLDMPVGQKESKVGGGFVLTVKSTRKSVRLPNGRYIHTVILFDDTGEMLADFKDPSPKDYSPLHKGWQPSIIVAEVQATDSTGRQKIDQIGKKLYVDQYSIPAQIGEPEDEYPDWRVTVRGKIRHGLTCAYVRSGREPDKKKILELENFVMNGE